MKMSPTCHIVVMICSVFAFTDEEKLSPVVTGVCSDVGKTIYAGSIGTQIANEHIETFRCVCVCLCAQVFCVCALHRARIMVFVQQGCIQRTTYSIEKHLQ